MNSDFNVAIHAMVYLSHQNCTLSSDSLAQNICTNPARVRKVMAKLGKGGLIHTKEGLEGGYQLAMPAEQITLEQISQALDVKFVCTSWKSGDPQKPCLIASGMGDMMDRLYDHLDQICKERLAAITLNNIEQQLFLGKSGDHTPCAQYKKNA